MLDLSGKSVWVAGHKGMVGSAIVRRLAKENCTILTADRAELDLLDQKSVEAWVAHMRPDVIFLAAARVGGIFANDKWPAEFLYQNIAIQTNIIHAAHCNDVPNLLFLGSSCIYPKFADQPIVEESLLTGALEPTNEWYAVAKIAGLKMAQAYQKQYGRNYISAMPTNLYGPGDNFNLESSHVLPALLRKAHEAKIEKSESITIWGSGSPRREFLHVDDCADACVFLMKNYSQDTHVNVGSGSDISIYELATQVCDVVGFNGKIERDPTKPDGTPRKLMSTAKIRALGWQPEIGLKVGISSTYEWFLTHDGGLRS
jgi:GDP-L-fucose synthase